MKKGSPDYYDLAERISETIESYYHPDSRAHIEVPDLDFINKMLDREIDRNRDLKED
jgi:adenylate kinase family enzyme